MYIVSLKQCVSSANWFSKIKTLNQATLKHV